MAIFDSTNFFSFNFRNFRILVIKNLGLDPDLPKGLDPPGSGTLFFITTLVQAMQVYLLFWGKMLIRFCNFDGIP